MVANVRIQIWACEQYHEVVNDPRYNDLIIAKAGWRPYLEHVEPAQQEEQPEEQNEFEED